MSNNKLHPYPNRHKQKGNSGAAFITIMILAIIAVAGWFQLYFKQEELKESQKQAVKEKVSLEWDIKQLRHDLSRRDQKIKYLEADQGQLHDHSKSNIKQADIQIKELREEPEQLQRRKRELNKSLQEHQATIAQLEETTRHRQLELLQLRQSLSASENIQEDLRLQLKETKHTLSENKQVIDKQQTQLTQYKATTASLKPQIVKMEQERKKDTERLANLQARLESELNEKNVRIQQLQDRITSIDINSEILFDSGSTYIKPSGQRVLSLVSETLMAYPDRLIRIEGHTDNIPTSETSNYHSNWELSAARAASAVLYLQHVMNIDPARMQVVGHGPYRPIATNETLEGRSMNRRIEIKLLLPATTNPQQ